MKNGNECHYLRQNIRLLKPRLLHIQNRIELPSYLGVSSPAEGDVSSGVALGRKPNAANLSLTLCKPCSGAV